MLGLAGCSGSTEATWGNGIRRHEGGGQAGAEEGLWTYWYRDGQMRQRGHYEGGLPVGLWVQYWPGGQRASQGERKISPRTGASEREGLWVHWHGSGHKQSEGHYSDGLRTGDWKFWKETGEEEASRCGRYENDRRVE